MKSKIIPLFTLLSLITVVQFAMLGQASAATSPDIIKRDIVFPVTVGTTSQGVEGVSYEDSFYFFRSSTRRHLGVDIFGAKRQALISAVDGKVCYVGYDPNNPTSPFPSWGQSFAVCDSEGYEYWYLHVNNDTPNTDDGKGGTQYAYAPGLAVGQPVVKGQFLGYLGDSGNAEPTAPHLHFEILKPGTGDNINPYYSLLPAQRLAEPRVNADQALYRAYNLNKPYIDGANGGAPQVQFAPFGGFTGGVNVTTGQFEKGGEMEMALTPGKGGEPVVQVRRLGGGAVTSFSAFPNTILAGLAVAGGDVDKDGQSEIIVAPESSGYGSHVKVFSTSGALLSQFMAFSNYNGGTTLAAADVDGDGAAEIIAGTRSGNSLVRIFKVNGEILAEYSYGDGYMGGVDVAAGPWLPNAPATVYVSQLQGVGVKVFNALDVAEISKFNAFDPSSFTGGVRINLNQAFSYLPTGAWQLSVTPYSNGVGNVKILNQAGHAFLNHVKDGQALSGGYDSAVAPSRFILTTGAGKPSLVRVYINDK